MISQSYLYFNHVKISTSFQTIISIGSLILFSFCGAPCTSPGVRRRIRQNPFMLLAIPHLVYISLYIFSFMALFYYYIRVHSLPLGITNDAMLIVDERTTIKTLRDMEMSNEQLFFEADHQRTPFNEPEMENETELISNKNKSTAFFLLSFLYIIYVSCRVVLTDLEKNIPDDPNGSVKQIAAYIIMTMVQLLMLVLYLTFIALVSLTWVYFCAETRQCIMITMTFAILIGIIAGFVESGKPWPKKRDNTLPADPFGWFENLLRSRFTVLVILFSLVNWSFFEDRRGPNVTMKERSFLTFTVVVTAFVVHVTKIFSIIAIKRAEKVITAYRLIVADDVELQNARNNLVLEIPDPPPILIRRPSIDAYLEPAPGSISGATPAQCTAVDISSDPNQNTQQESITDNKNEVDVLCSCPGNSENKE